MALRVLIICGQTATGKTAAALQFAKDFSGDVISADSRQVYKYMDIGTGKDLPAQAVFELVNKKVINGETYDIGFYTYGGIRLWLYDCLKPDQQINVSHMSQLVRWTIDQAASRHRLPIIVGGDGFYISNIIQPSPTLNIPPNLSLRAQLEQESVPALQQRLRSISPDKWMQLNQSDRRNPRRLIRAIEVAEYQFQSPAVQPDLPEYVSMWIGLRLPPEVLEGKISARVQNRVKSGFEAEISKILSLYPDFFALPASNTLGYSQWLQVVAGNISKEEAVSCWLQAEINYAKRQKTWFQKNPHISWFDIQSNSWYAQARTQVDKGLTGD